MVAISIIVILLAVACPSTAQHYPRQGAEPPQEFQPDHLIYQYAQDKQKSPQSLSDLVSSKYIDKIPDDITAATPGHEPRRHYHVRLSDEDTGIIGVHSGSSGTATDGTPTRSGSRGLRSQVSGLRSQSQVSGLRSQVSGLRSQVSVSGLRFRKGWNHPDQPVNSSRVLRFTTNRFS